MKKLMKKVTHKDKDHEKEKEKKEKHKDKKKHKEHKEEKPSTSGAAKHTEVSTSKTTAVTKTSGTGKPVEEKKTVTTTQTSGGPEGKKTTVTETKHKTADGVTEVTKESHTTSDKPQVKQEDSKKVASHASSEPQGKTTTVTQTKQTTADGVTLVTKETSKSDKHEEKREAPKKALASHETPATSHASPTKSQTTSVTSHASSVVRHASSGDSEPKQISTVTTRVSKDDGKTVETVAKTVSKDGRAVTTEQTKTSQESLGPRSPGSPGKGKTSLSSKSSLSSLRDDKIEANEEEAVPSQAVAKQSATLPNWLKEVKEEEKPKNISFEADDPSLEVKVKVKAAEKPVRKGVSEVVETVQPEHIGSSPGVDMRRIPHDEHKHSSSTSSGERTSERTSNDEGYDPYAGMEVHEPLQEKEERKKKLGYVPRWMVGVRKKKSGSTVDLTDEENTSFVSQKSQEDDDVFLAPSPVVLEEVSPVRTEFRDSYIFFGVEDEPFYSPGSVIHVNLEPEDYEDLNVTCSLQPHEHTKISHDDIPVREDHLQRRDVDRQQSIDMSRLPTEEGRDGTKRYISTLVIMRQASREGNRPTTVKVKSPNGVGNRRGISTAAREPEAVPTKRQVRHPGDFPSWLRKVEPRPSVRVAGTIDQTLPDPIIGIKVSKKTSYNPVCSGPKVVEEIHPLHSKTNNEYIYFDGVKHKAESRQENDVSFSEPDELFDFNIKSKPEYRVHKRGPVQETCVQRRNSEKSMEIDFGRLPEDEKSPKKPNPSKGYRKYQTQTKTTKTISKNGESVTTKTHKVSDDKGTQATTETRKTRNKPMEGETDHPENVVASSHTRTTEPLPEWLVEVKKEPPKRAINHSIPDPFDVEIKKEAPKVSEPKGETVVEEIYPISEAKKTPFVYFDGIEVEHQQNARQESQPNVEPEELFDFDVKPSEPERKYEGSPVREGPVQSEITESAPEIDFTRLDRGGSDRHDTTRGSTTITTKKVVSDGGKTVTTTSQETADDKGRRTTTETRTTAGEPKDAGRNKKAREVDANANLVPQTKKTAQQQVENEPEDEFMEEIIVVNKKRKARIPKNFLAYEKQKPDPAAFRSLESIVDVPKRPQKAPIRQGRVVTERIDESKSDKRIDLPDLELLEQVVKEIEGQ